MYAQKNMVEETDYSPAREVKTQLDMLMWGQLAQWFRDPSRFQGLDDKSPYIVDMMGQTVDWRFSKTYISM